MSQENPKQEPKIEEVENVSSRAIPEVKEELSKVASSPQRNLIVFASMAIGFAFLAYKLIVPQIFGSGKRPYKQEVVEKPEKIAEPSSAQDSLPSIPQLPEPPKLVIPTPPKIELPEKKEEAPPPPLPPVAPEPAPQVVQTPAALPNAVVLGGTASEDAQKRLEAKRKAPIQMVGGKDVTAHGEGPSDVVSANEQASDFKKRGDLNFVLGKGKIIDVVTETAINSDFQSEVRAVVTRDVFSESGKVILIPKGTRVFGDFSLSSSGGYGRVSIKWKRIDLNSGYTVNISSDAVDNLGRTGAQGVVDNKYTEQFANAVLSSAFSIAVAAGIDKVVPPAVPTQGAANATLATNIQNGALAIFNGNGTEDEKVTQICSSVQGMMPDKTSTVYTAFVQACITSMNLQAGQKLSSIMNAVTSASTGLVTATAIASTPTHKQEAAEDAYKNLTAKMQDIVQQQALKPTTTIDQGHPIKIFVNKDYLFPKDAVVKSRLLK